jgi:hypothetical protein
MTDYYGQDEPHFYEIRIIGHLEDHWSEWFDDLTLARQKDGTTTFFGPVADQAALHGLLIKIRDMGLPLLSLNRIAPDRLQTNTLESE